ncbi:MAG TPA: Ig-like domain-containing protein [Nitrososphaeraceae archaeon]|nr:Ig-like domain-containing protein [Nitrososphaeraceae archaeon]
MQILSNKIKTNQKEKLTSAFLTYRYWIKLNKPIYTRNLLLSASTASAAIITISILLLFAINISNIISFVSIKAEQYAYAVSANRPPSIRVPSHIVAEAGGPDGSRVTYSVEAKDGNKNPISTVCNPVSNSVFRIGDTIVYCTTERPNNNSSTASKSFIITVKDTSPPLIVVPNKNIIEEATGPSGAQVFFSSSATDLVDGVLQLLCNPASGSVFPLGQTVVKCSATDNAGNTASKYFRVIVEDTIPPDTTFVSARVTWTGFLVNDSLTPSNDIVTKFTGTDIVGVNHFECKIDKGGWHNTLQIIDKGSQSTCGYFDLSEGNHFFQVRAVDSAGNIDPTPQSFTWNIVSPSSGISDLINLVSNLMLVKSIGANVVTDLNQALLYANAHDEAKNANVCIKLDSFFNRFMELDINDLVTSDQKSKVVYLALAIKDHVGCPPPDADAGPDQEISQVTKSVTLDGTGSLDPKDGHKLGFSWKQTAGLPIVKLRNPNSAKAQFDVPVFIPKEGTRLIFQLTVTDSDGLISTSSVNVNIQGTNSMPVVEGKDIFTNENQPITISLTGSDVDGDKLTFAIVAKPESGRLGAISYSGPNSARVVYTPATGYTGDDSFTFKANDGTLDSKTATVSIRVNSINQAPVVNDKSTATDKNKADLNINKPPKEQKAKQTRGIDSKIIDQIAKQVGSNNGTSEGRLRSVLTQIYTQITKNKNSSIADDSLSLLSTDIANDPNGPVSQGLLELAQHDSLPASDHFTTQKQVINQLSKEIANGQSITDVVSDYTKLPHSKKQK